MQLFKSKMNDTSSPEPESSPKDHIATQTLTPATTHDNSGKKTDNINRGFGYAIKPFFSNEHRTAITQQCIAKALSTMMEDRDQEEGEELTVREEVHPRESKYDWSRALRTQLRWDRLFLLCESTISAGGSTY